MKILHLLEHSLPHLSGYAIRSKYILQTQRQDGLEPVVLTSPLHHDADGDGRVVEVIDQIAHFRTRQRYDPRPGDLLPVRLWKRYRASTSYGRSIVAIATQEKARVIHAHSSYLNGVRGNQAARALGLPSVYEVRGLWHDTATVNDDIDTGHWKYRFIEHMERKAMLGADRVVTLSRQLRSELLHKGVREERLHVVPNGVDTAWFHPRPKHPAILDTYGLRDKVVLGFIGSIRRIEGLELLLQVLPRLVREAPQVHCLIVGSGDELAHLKQIADQHGMHAHISFTGAVAHNKILDYYSVMDVLVYPRINARVNHKVTPLKPLEAMAMEKVVVASDVGGLAEIVSDGRNGLLFKTEDGDHLVHRCLDLLHHPSHLRALGEEARRWAVNEREWSALAKQYHHIYTELVAAHPA